jgi:hypothetical protein
MWRFDLSNVATDNEHWGIIVIESLTPPSPYRHRERINNDVNYGAIAYA